MVRRGSCEGMSISVHLAAGVQERSQCWTILIPAADQQRHTERPGHYALLTLCTLTEPQRQIAYALRTALDGQRLGVVEGVRLRRDSARLSASLVLTQIANLFQHTAHAQQVSCCRPADPR